VLSHDDKMVVWTTWSGVLDGLAGLDAMCREYRKFNQQQDIERKNALFAITNASFLAGTAMPLSSLRWRTTTPSWILS